MATAHIPNNNRISSSVQHNGQHVTIAENKQGKKNVSEPVQPAHLKNMHRIEKVREEQGISLRSVARAMDMPLSEVRDQEQGKTDLTLSQLYRWQEILDVPIEDLLLEPDSILSRPIKERSQLIRLMKTVQTVLESTTQEKVKRLAETMFIQLTEMMPELEEVTSWHSVGQRRSLDEISRIMEFPISDEFFR